LRPGISAVMTSRSKIDLTPALCLATDADMSERLTIPIGCGASMLFSGSDRGHRAFAAILLQLPDDVSPHFAIDSISIGARELPEPFAGEWIELCLSG
jgi:hypothetical protein